MLIKLIIYSRVVLLILTNLLSIISLVLVSQFFPAHLTDINPQYYKSEVKSMFQFAYDSYLIHAYPYDELRPLTCDGRDTWGQYSLTLIDSLDTLVIMKNYSEFHRAVDLIISSIDFNKNVNVSVFETNIRVVGGLLSAHLLSKRAGLKLADGWPCSGPLLALAERVARRLLPAFDTKTGMPYGTVNLRYGVPYNETAVTCTAGIGTFIVEFGALSKLTGDPIFENVAMRALNSLWTFRSDIGLVGNHINVQTGEWTALDAGIGAGVDSYFEYLVKGALLFHKPRLMNMFNTYRAKFDKYLLRDDWFMWAHMSKGSITLPIFQSLDAFWPGLLTLIGDVDQAKRILFNSHQIVRQYGFHPEFFHVGKTEAYEKREGYPLRPEHLESLFHLHVATKDPIYRKYAAEMITAIQYSARTKCGYATIENVKDHTLANRMESFFLAETTKYLYLIFEDDNFIYDTDTSETILTPSGECIIDAGGYIFNTEAHLIDAAALYCCSSEKRQSDIAVERLISQFDLSRLITTQPQYPEDEIISNIVMQKKNKKTDENDKKDYHFKDAFKDLTDMFILPEEKSHTNSYFESSEIFNNFVKNLTLLKRNGVHDKAIMSIFTTCAERTTKHQFLKEILSWIDKWEEGVLSKNADSNRQKYNTINGELFLLSRINWLRSLVFLWSENDDTDSEIGDNAIIRLSDNEVKLMKEIDEISSDFASFDVDDVVGKSHRCSGSSIRKGNADSDNINSINLKSKDLSVLTCSTHSFMSKLMYGGEVLGDEDLEKNYKKYDDCYKQP